MHTDLENCFGSGRNDRHRQTDGQGALVQSTDTAVMGVRTQEQMGSADPPGKMDEKLKSENTQKRAVFYVYVIF